MRLGLAFGSALALAFAGAAIATPRFRIVVPVEMEALPAPITIARIECAVSSVDPFDVARVIGRSFTQFAVEGGRFSRRIAVEVFPTGFPVEVDGTLEGRSFSCSLFLEYRCPTPERPDGWCVSASGGRAMPRTPESIASLFSTDPARPPTGVVTDRINRAGATTLPIRR